jgi:hypothetical protein
MAGEPGEGTSDRGLAAAEGGEGISEAASEIQPPKRKRGRPKIHEGPAYATMRSFIHPERTERCCQDRVIACRAAGVLSSQPDAGTKYRWLMGDRFKWSLLAELGRVLESHGEGDVVSLAGELCGMNPKLPVKQAIAQTRRFRLGTKADGDTVALSNRIVDDEAERTIRTLLAEIEELGAEVAELLAEKARLLGDLAAKIEEAIDLAKENVALRMAGDRQEQGTEG